MTDYEALIRATLNTEDVDKKIAALQNQTISLTLDLRSGNVSIDSFLKNIQTQMQSAGANAGQQFTNQFQSSIRSSLSHRSGDIANLSNVLKSFKFSSSDIDKVTQDLSRMNLEITRITTSMNSKGLRVNVSGIDELNRAVTIVKQFDNESGSLSTVGEVIAQSFDTSVDGAKRFQKAVDDAFSSIKEKSKDLSTLSTQRAGLDPIINAKEIEQIDERINRLKSDISEMQSQFGGFFSQKQNSDIVSITERMNAAIDQTRAKLEDTSAIQAQRDAFKELSSLQSKMYSSKIDLVKAQGDGRSSEEIDRLKSAFDEARDAYVKLKSTLSENLSTDQLKQLNSAAEESRNKISALWEKQKEASSIKTQKKEYEDLSTLQSRMYSKQKEYIQQRSKGQETDYVERLKDEFEQLEKAYTEKKASVSRKLSADQRKKIETSEIQGKSEIEDLRAKLESGVEFKVNTDDYKSKVSSLTEQLQNLQERAQQSGIKLNDSKIGIVQEKLSRIAELQEKIGQSNGENIAAYYEQYKQAVSDAEKALSDLNKTEAKEEQTKQKSTTLSNKMSAWMSQNEKAAKAYGTQIEALQEKLKDNSNPQVYQEAQLGFQKIQAQAKAAGLTVDSFGNSLKNIAKQALGLTSAFAVFQKLKQVFSEMYQNLYDIDTAMTNLYKVTDETDSKYASFLKNAKSDAQELGLTVSSLIDQSATWAKLGYKIDEAQSLAKVSAVYSNVGELGDDRAVSDLVTAMKAFNIEAKDAATIVDPLNELGNNFSTSAGDLGIGLTKSASTLKLAGVSLNEALAMLTGGSEITQNAQEFGNAIKVAAMRIRGMKGELEELGEEVDDNVDSISKVQTEILNLTHGKVNIFDSNGDFRDYYEIMKDISAIFNDLKSTDQAALSEVLFGKVRGNQGAALIQAFQSGQVEKALETANNSAGSAAKEQERWMESLEAKTNSFKASWQGLSESFLDSDFLKGAIDSGTGFLNVLTSIVDTFGTLPPLITAVTAGLSAFKNVGRDKTSSLLNMPTAVDF